MLQLNTVKERFIFLSPTVQAGKEREPTINDFKILGGLGAGAFGKVYKAEHKTSKIVYALKQISKQQLKQQKMINQIKIEIKIMYGLFHPNVIKLFNHFEENDFIYLIIEFAEGGQLWDKMNRKGRFDEKTVQQYMREMVAAIEYCHSRDPPIIHRDIKPENILLDKEGHIKLADFGWSNFFNPTAKRKTYCGTLDYLAPEMIEETGHDMSLDYWSLGVLTYELLTGKAPFTPPPGLKDQKQIQQQLEQNILKGKIDFPKDFPPLAKDLVLKVLKRNPKQRISIEEMKDHPWLKVPGSKPSAQSPRTQKPNFFANLLSGSKSPENKSTAASADTSALNTSQASSQGGNAALDTSTSSKSGSDMNNNAQKAKPAEENKSKEATPAAVAAQNVDKNKEFVLTVENAEGWTDKELNEYSARPQSIMNKPPEPQAVNANANATKTNGMETSKSEDLFQRFSVSYNKKDEERQEVTEELNKTIKQLRNEVSELSVQLKLRDKEVEDMKKEYEKLKSDFSPNMGTPEGKRIMMLEEEKQKLKKEIDDIWQTVETKEAELQKKNLELKKLEETKTIAEKYKNEKSTLSKQLKELQAKFNQSNSKIMELQQEKEDERQKYEKMLKEAESKAPDRFATNDQQKLKELVEFAKTAMDEMQAKINYYKEKSDSIEKMEKELNEKRIKLVKIEAESEEKLNATKRQIELEYEDKIAKLKDGYKADLERVETRNKELIKNLEQEIATLKGVQFDKDEAEAKLESYKLEIKSLKTNNETLSGLCTNLQTLKDDNEKKIAQLKCEVEDMKIKNDLLKKSYSKAK